MSTVSDDLEQSTDRAIRLFQYLKELSELRTRMIRSVDAYESVLWLADIPHEPECFSASWFLADDDAAEERWLAVGKPRPLEPQPDIPNALLPWVDADQLADSSTIDPALKPEIQIPVPEEESSPESEEAFVVVSLEVHPEIEALWDRYCERTWRPWAEEDQRRRRIQSVYADLFSIYQRQQRLGEQFEVVLSLGLLGWKAAGGHVVRRHLLTAQTGMSFDPISGVITVGPAGEGARLELEQDMLEATERPDLSEQRTIERQQEQLAESLWQAAPLGALFSAWVHAVSANGQYDDSSDPVFPIGPDPFVRLAPALILRKRTERSLIRMFGDIIERLENGEPLPAGVRRLVEVVDDAAFGEQFGPNGSHESSDSEVYFPLPANDEQREIVGRLSSRQGVLVQGPPGTGKSHTIANLVCHLLATGQRVLVTSHTPRALKVLRDKIPTEIRPLCVSLLGDDQAALKNLEESVHGITDRYYRWDVQQSQTEIARLTGELDRARRAEAEALRNLLEIREAETLSQPLPVPGYAGTAEAIARQLVADEPLYAWIDTQPALDAEPPLQAHEALQFLALLRRLPPSREAEVRLSRVASAEIPRPEQFRAMVDHEAAARQRTESGLHAGAADVSQFANLDRSVRDDLRERLDALLRGARSLQTYPEQWVENATAQVFAGRELVWRQLLAETATRMIRIESSLAAVGDPVVGGLEGRDERVALSDATDLAAHLASGGKWGVGPFRPEPVKRALYLTEGVTVDGRRCNQPDTLQHLIRWLNVMEDLRVLHRQWAAYVPAPAGPMLLQTAAYRDLQKTLGQLMVVADLLAGVRRALAQLPGLAETPAVYNSPGVQNLLEQIDAATRIAELQAAQDVFIHTSRLLGEALGTAGNHAVVARIAAAVETRDDEEYATGYGVLTELERDQIDLAERDRLAGRLRATAPQLLERLHESRDDAVWDTRLASILAAWDWARADAYVAGKRDLRVYQDLVRKLTHTREQIHASMGKLAAERAWRYCFERMTESERQNLMAWMQAMRKIGKGTGKYAVRHRQAARTYMEACRSAIPAWIMPIYRVAETARPGADVFDVVIVDEASQSGPEALFLQYIARQIVVVGDDQQISPESVGINREEVMALQARHIPDLEFRDNLGVDNSFFDQAVIRFGGRIRLREHFRCMPEIIQFSNDLSYRSEPLYPLRQYGIDRLSPIKVVHVPDGYRQGDSARATNPPEAQALVDQLIACHENPVYAGKTMGVISLQGGAQAKLIERLLLDQFGPEAFESRQIVCGDAYAFQGDERDIIFMSLVAARGQTHNPRALTGEADTRRFNVAASRARDQVWLFHTIGLGELNPNCLRYKLLSYYTNPTVDSAEPPADVFDSPFEQEVYRRIQGRGYRVRPQVEVAGYRIDLVVEGTRGRVAVECDGERWHGPERYQDDMARQRHLERCGWNFWRVRGGTFYRDPDAALEDLWLTLTQFGIHPAGFTPGPGDALAVVGLAEDARLAAPDEPMPLVEMEPVEVVLPFAPFTNWTVRPLPHPLDVDEQEIMRGLQEIVEREGPMPCHRAYRVYATGAKLAAIDAATRSVLNRVMYRGVVERRWVERNETSEQGQLPKIVRMAGSPPVRIRERGDRLLQEIPPSEIAAALVMLAEHTERSVAGHAEELFKELLHMYRLSEPSEQDAEEVILQRALAILELTASHQSTSQQSLF